MTNSQYIAMLYKNTRKEREEKEELKLRLEELEGQYAYECECNKQFVETQNKCERYKILLINALILLEENGFGGDSFAINEIGITSKEYREIMGEPEQEEDE